MAEISDPSLFILAGENSGDLYGSLLAKSIFKLAPGAKIQGVGGTSMQNAGVELIRPISDLSIMGVSEVLFHLPKIMALRNQVVDHIVRSGTGTVVLIDFPDFNLSVAKKIFHHKKHLDSALPKIYYFIPPHVWIWRKKRIHTIKQLCEGVFPLFAFEHDLYTNKGIKSFYAGHPISDTLPGQYYQNTIKNQVTNVVFTLLPGSRLQEVTKILPVMFSAAMEYNRTWNTDKKVISIKVIQSNGISPDIYWKIVKRSGLQEIAELLPQVQSHKSMAESDLILAKSGTVNLETAFLKKPFIVIYITSFLTWLSAILFIHIRYISLVNILSDKPIVKEFIQYKAKPIIIAEEINHILTNDSYKKRMIEQLSDFSDRFVPNRSGSVTDAIAKFILNDTK